MEETMVKGVILDFNGTLFFDSQFHDIAWKMISKEIRGYEMSDEELINHMHGKNNEMVIKYLKSDIDDETNKKYSLLKEEKYRQMCKAHPDMFHLAPGVITFFEYLNNHHIPFTIASASIKENIDFFIESFELAKVAIWLLIDKIKFLILSFNIVKSFIIFKKEFLNSFGTERDILLKFASISS